MITYKLGALCLQRACSKSVCVLVVLRYKALIHELHDTCIGCVDLWCPRTLAPEQQTNFGSNKYIAVPHGLGQDRTAARVLDDSSTHFWTLLGLGKYSEFRFQSFSVSESFLRFGKVVEASGRFQVQFQRFGKGCGELRWRKGFESLKEVCTLLRIVGRFQDEFWNLCLQMARAQGSGELWQNWMSSAVVADKVQDKVDPRSCAHLGVCLPQSCSVLGDIIWASYQCFVSFAAFAVVFCLLKVQQMFFRSQSIRQRQVTSKWPPTPAADLWLPSGTCEPSQQHDYCSLDDNNTNDYQ